MRCSTKSLLRHNLLLGLGLLLFLWVLVSGDEEVNTEAQAGPLYRVEGSRLSISCSVSGLTRPPGVRNDFRFLVKKPTSPIEHNIISTNDEHFAYAMYGRRVKTGEIVVKYTDPNSIIFEIEKLQKTDEGEYNCAVVNPKYNYFGTYSAYTTVKVIDNSLSVSSSSATTSLTQTEGDALALTCKVSTNTIQHTHLSLAWFLNSAENTSRPIISMDRDFTLIPGQGFEERYKAGLIRLDKIGAVTYTLTMSKLERSDEGAIYCEAQEWIQDPDRTWYSIAKKEAPKTTLTVKAKEVLSDSASLVVVISTPQSTLQEGQQLSVSCTINSQNLNERFFSLAWLRDGVELARIGPTGVLSVGLDYSSRETEGELRASRIGNSVYRLILQPVRASDQGEYRCRTWPQDRSQTGVFTEGAAQDSSSQNVIISATESGLSVEITKSVTIKEGADLELSCRVSGAIGQLSVAWQRKSASPSAPFANLISLSQDGVMTKAEGVDVKVKALHPTPDLFTLELREATQSDAGVYQCVVSEWKTSNKASSQLGTTNVNVTALESFVSTHLILRNYNAEEGQKVELICRVRGLSLPRTLTWSVRRDSATPDSILTLYSNGAISWFGDQHRYQLKIDDKNKQPNEMWYYLTIDSASRREAGNYQCSVSVVLENALRKMPPSNELALRVLSPVSDLILTSTPSIRTTMNNDVELKCSVSHTKADTLTLSRYAVVWFLQQQTGNTTIVTSDHDAFVTFGPEIEPSQRQRLSVSRTKGPSFILTIRNVRLSDRGLYVCEVMQWQQDPQREWHQFPPVSKSTQLTITEPASDLYLNKTATVLNVKEGDDVELECNLISVENGPSFFYKVIWIYSGQKSFMTNVTLVELDHMGLLTFPANHDIHRLQERLRLLRPTQRSFHLGIQMVHEEDSGSYICQVEQYQLDQDGQWLQKASAETNPIPLNVIVTEKNFSIISKDMAFNISTSQSLNIPCNITGQSSPKSEFQVTWFWQKDADTQHPVFTVYRNSTLQYWFGKNDEQLRFGHPSPNQFSLTLMKLTPAESGWYFCEVEEWVPSLSHGHRKVGVERSGYLTATVHNEGEAEGVSEPVCDSPKWIGAFVGTTLLLLLIIVLLILGKCRDNGSEKKKKESSLWTENHQLNPKD